jgi:hypothetical protein
MFEGIAAILRKVGVEVVIRVHLEKVNNLDQCPML